MIAPETLLQNRYLVHQQIGQGGMGTVYIATDQRFGSRVALKETLFNDPSLRKAFEREAHLLHRLRHPALPKVTDHFVEGDEQFLVMEFIPGEDLSEMLKARGEAFPLPEVMQWADQLLDALDYLHTQEMPVVHRDIKPQNLKLMARGQIVLLDFGLAKGNAMQMSRVTQTGSIFGYSRNYAPLEQIQGTGTDPRSDFYSLAATLYHLLTGTPPPDALTRATAVLNGHPDPLRPAHEVHAQIPLPVAGALQSALAQNASQRPQTAVAMRAALREAYLHAHDTVREANTPTSPPVAPTIFDQQTMLKPRPRNAATAGNANAANAASSPTASGGTGDNATAAVLENAFVATGRETPAINADAARVSDSILTKVTPASLVRPSTGWRSVRSLSLAASAVILMAIAVGVYALIRQPAPSAVSDAPPATPTTQPLQEPPASVPRAVENQKAQPPSAPATATTPLTHTRRTNEPVNRDSRRSSTARDEAAPRPLPQSKPAPTNEPHSDDTSNNDANKRDERHRRHSRRSQIPPGMDPALYREMRRAAQELRKAQTMRQRALEEERRRRRIPYPY